MKKIMCSIMDNKYVREYELSYEEQEVQEFLDGLEEISILPTVSNNDEIRLYRVMQRAEKFNKRNKLLTYDDIKRYIKELHDSSDVNLTELYVLMHSTGNMSKNQICEIFRNFFDLYSYKEVATYDIYHINGILRKFYELGTIEESPKMSLNVIRINTEALQNIGFSIEAKIEAKEKVIK